MKNFFYQFSKINKKSDVIIVGAGHNGLIAAALLAK
jgi:ribulose 1,5-bisphosphate synthetase/thiazole synthase